jgi:ketosteroid isomerase-like protein
VGGLAAQLVSAFGDIGRMSAFYDDEITWSLPPSVNGTVPGVKSPFRGRKDVLKLHAVINSAYDAASMRVEILDDLDNGEVSAVRFNFSARELASGETWTGSYTLFARSRGGLIFEVHEGMDTLAAMRFHGLALL